MSRRRTSDRFSDQAGQVWVWHRGARRFVKLQVVQRFNRCRELRLRRSPKPRNQGNRP